MQRTITASRTLRTSSNESSILTAYTAVIGGAYLWPLSPWLFNDGSLLRDNVPSTKQRFAAQSVWSILITIYSTSRLENLSFLYKYQFQFALFLSILKRIGQWHSKLGIPYRNSQLFHVFSPTLLPSRQKAVDTHFRVMPPHTPQNKILSNLRCQRVRQQRGLVLLEKCVCTTRAWGNKYTSRFRISLNNLNVRLLILLRGSESRMIWSSGDLSV